MFFQQMKQACRNSSRMNEAGARQDQGLREGAGPVLRSSASSRPKHRLLSLELMSSSRRDSQPIPDMIVPGSEPNRTITLPNAIADRIRQG